MSDIQLTVPPTRGPRPIMPAIEVKMVASIAEIPQADWDRLLPGDPESWSFYQAIEDVPPPGFVLGAMVARSNGRIVGVAPVFRTEYRLDTPFQGALRKIGDWVHARAPWLVSMWVAGIGSPMSDNCSLGLDRTLSLQDRLAVFEAMLGALQADAATHNCALIAVKSLDGLALELDPVFQTHAFNRVTSVPLVMLDLNYRTFDEYLASLPSKDRSYLKRRNKTASLVRIEFRNSIEGLESKVYELFQNTLRESKVDYGDFEQLHPDYFPRLTQALRDKAPVVLVWQGDELLSFNLFLLAPGRALAKQIGMKYPEARDLNLYFVNWIALVEYCIENGISVCEMGATTYATKLLFGGYLERRWLHFRFRSDLANRLLRPLAPLFDFERNDPELKALKPAQRARMRGLPGQPSST